MMLEGQVEKDAQVRCGRLIEAAGQGPAGDVARHLIGGEGMGAVAEDVARNLVGNQDQGERAGGLLLPGRQCPARRLAMQGREVFMQRGIEIRVGGEPAFRAGLTPEGQDLVRFSGA